MANLLLPLIVAALKYDFAQFLTLLIFLRPYLPTPSVKIMKSESKTILLIDDAKTILVGLSAIIRRAGYGVLTASNGKSGLHLAKTHRPNLIICDVMMPPPNGFQLCKILSEEKSTYAIPFIFLTVRKAQMDRLHGLELGATAYITKPFDHKELLAMIKSVLRQAELSRKQALIESQEEIKQLRKQILSNVSHELRTPVSLVLQTLEISAKQQGTNGSRQKETLEVALNNAHYLQDIVNDLIILSQLDQGVVNDFRQVVYMEHEFLPLISRYKKRWEDKNLNVQINITPNLVIHAPKMGLKQAVGHLLDNAFKFSPHNGHINIHFIQNGKGGCILNVVNQGNNIPKYLREKVFDRFYQIKQETTRQYNGLGIGLTIARSFARGVGGDVVILDTHKGCWVQMTIPPAEADWMM
jgi:signal transduction histidine kinase